MQCSNKQTNTQTNNCNNKISKSKRQKRSWLFLVSLLVVSLSLSFSHLEQMVNSSKKTLLTGLC